MTFSINAFSIAALSELRLDSSFGISSIFHDDIKYKSLRWRIIRNWYCCCLMNSILGCVSVISASNKVNFNFSIRQEVTCSLGEILLSFSRVNAIVANEFIGMEVLFFTNLIFIVDYCYKAIIAISLSACLSSQ